MIFLSLFFSDSFAQKQAEVLENAISNYKSSLENWDTKGAVSALNRIIDIEGEKSLYLDTLSKLYYQLGYYKDAYNTGKIRLKHFPADFLLHEFLGVCAYKSNDLQNSVIHYSEAFKLTKGSLYAFHSAKIYNEMGNFNEALNYIEEAEKHLIPEDYEFKVYYASKEKDRVEVILPAAIFNLKGLVYFNLNQFKNALKSFESALKIDPVFEIAIENKRMINSVLEENKLYSPKRWVRF